MSQRRSIRNADQGDLFADARALYPVRAPKGVVTASDSKLRIAQAISEALHECGKSRGQVAYEMSSALGETISDHMLNAYASPAREGHDITVTRFRALVQATGCIWLWEIATEGQGVSVLAGRDAIFAQIGLVKKQQELLSARLRELAQIAPVEPDTAAMRAPKARGALNMKAWLALSDLAAAALPGLPSTVRGLQLLVDREGWANARNARHEPLARPRQGRGGGLEFHVTLLPAAARALLQPASALSAPPTREDAWAAFDRLPEAKKAEARRRAAILTRVEELALAGGRTAAVQSVAAEEKSKGVKLSQATIYEWFKAVAGLDKPDRLPALAPRHQGGQIRSEIDDEVFRLFQADWLRPSQPSWEGSYRRTAQLAAAQGLAMPKLAVLRRRVLRDTPPSVIILRREGPEALKAAFPHQTRDRTAFSACEAMVADGHTWDVMVRWPDGSLGRPTMVAVSDLYSNKILSWRIGRSSTSDAVQLTFGDAFRSFGIPNDFWLDNGREFAAKSVTGGQPNRYRFKTLPEDPEGMLTALGVRVHWTHVFSGQSKPIERSFKDFAHDLAKHPAFEGAFTGHNPVAKPSNYGSAAVALDSFVDIAASSIAEWNARPGRRSQVCAGRMSFDEAFEASYASAVVKKATAEQLRLCMLASRPLTCAADDGAVMLDRNRYQTEAMLALRGERVHVRFDPQDMHGEVYIYDLSHRFICAAPCIVPAGFADMDAGRKHARARADFIRAGKALAKAEVRYEAEDLAALHARLTKAAPATQPDPKIVRPVFGALALQARALPAPDDAFEPDHRNSLDRLAEHRAAFAASHLKLVADE